MPNKYPSTTEDSSLHEVEPEDQKLPTEKDTDKSVISSKDLKTTNDSESDIILENQVSDDSVIFFKNAINNQSSEVDPTPGIIDNSELDAFISQNFEDIKNTFLNESINDDMKIEVLRSSPKEYSRKIISSFDATAATQLIRLFDKAPWLVRFASPELIIACAQLGTKNERTLKCLDEQLCEIFLSKMDDMPSLWQFHQEIGDEKFKEIFTKLAHNSAELHYLDFSHF